MNSKKLLSVALGAMLLCPGMKADGGLAILLIGSAIGTTVTGLGIAAAVRNEIIYQSDIEKENRKIAQKKVAAGEWQEGMETGGLVHMKSYSKVNKDVKNTEREDRADYQFASRWYSAPLSVIIPVVGTVAGFAWWMSHKCLKAARKAKKN